MGSYNRDDNRSGGYRGGFNRGGDRGGFRGGRPSFGGGRGGDREMFSTICSNCGKECQVPFKPTNGKPVYCSECFEKMGNRSGDSRRFDDRAPRAPQAQNSPDLSAINAKLDKILSILEPKAPVIEAPIAKVEKIAEKIDLTKVKKAVKKAAKKVASDKK
jgi:CxxC-x17-CxxC domain-containing protein